MTAAPILHGFAKTRMRFSMIKETSNEMKIRSLTQLLALLKSLSIRVKGTPAMLRTGS